MIVLLSTIVAQGQITIGGNVYGGGNAGDTEGSTTVTVRGGDINNVFGGARMANVGGRAFVNIDGKKASKDILIANVYGGNDISGTIGQSATLPTELENVKTETSSTDKTKNTIDNTWNAFVKTSPCTTKHSATISNQTIEADEIMVVVGSLYGGGNGEYVYKAANGTTDLMDNDGHYIVKDEAGNTVATSTSPFTKPELGKTYLEVKGGCIAHVYGGGNNATVTENTTINIDNTSDDLQKAVAVWSAVNNKDMAEVQQYLQTKVRLATFQSDLSSLAFNFARIFGGNNKAPMAIRPVWNLQKGIIRDVYSGGNQGAMTSPNGILLEIQPVESDKLVINNVFGGCRMADVNPAKVSIPAETINGTYYPAGYAARILVEGGDINNVYGGNDISGNIYGGNAVGIHSSINGDVYGGGNGSYAYTDKLANKGTSQYGDFYYDPGSNSAAALNAFRPNAESVSIRVIGTENKPTTIGGAIYCGGNSATLRNDDPSKNAAAELKIGSYVIADKVFLGNNGEKMVTDDMLAKYADNTFSTIDLKNSEVMKTYMDGVTMEIMPRVVFDDVGTYEPYSTYFGSFYCGGNVGSMRMNGAINLNFNDKVVIFDKVVGGSNEANVYASANNAQYLGGLLGNTDANGNKLILNFNGLKIQPMRWKIQRDNNYAPILADGKEQYVLDENGNRQLEWNTVDSRQYNTTTKTYAAMAPVLTGTGKASADDRARRFKGGNIYGGCYSNGHVEGNVIINLNATIHERDKLFDVTDEGDKLYENVENADYNISERKSGVILSEQGTDVYGEALNVFGGGYGGDSEIWGSTTINLNKGYTFQIFGGGEQGAIGNADSSTEDPNNPSAHILHYSYNQKYSTTINLNGDVTLPGVARGAEGDSNDMAECEYIYGGGFEGVIAGDTHVNLNNGRIFNAFGGSCNADILGHTETYIGKNGFPYIRDYVYGGNDLGGIISGYGDFSNYFRDEEVKSMVYEPSLEQVKKITTYTEYIQGRVDYILGGGSGNYDYTDEAYTTRVTSKPYQHNTFVNFRPNANTSNKVNKIFGAGEGYPGDRDGDDLQAHSYVLIDIPEGNDLFADTEVFGAGANNGLGMGVRAADTFEENFNLNEVSAIIDLARGTIGAAYGGSYEEGITRRTVVNVPAQSSINIKNIFGGAYGTQILPPCDVYESNVNYSNTSEKARVTGAIYGGNNNERRTLYAHVNISSPVWSNKGDGYTAKVYGAGKGIDTWSEYTEVNLESGANVYEVYGGGEMGHVLNAESVMKYMQLYQNKPSPQISTDDPKWKKSDKWTGGVVGSTLKDEATIADWQKDWKAAWTFGDYYICQGNYTAYSSNTNMNLENTHEVRTYDELDAKSTPQLVGKKYNANVIIHEGATVSGYAYGGGYGSTSDALSGDVYGTTYIALLGGTIEKDIYAAGTAGAVYDLFGVGAKTQNNLSGFTASANAYVKGGMVRNVFGGGWRGSVGYHNGLISDVANNASDNLGETHVVIGNLDGSSITNGIPAINRNVYGGGEGGGIFGTAFVTINNGRIGYRYKNTAAESAPANYEYVEELDDAKAGDNLLDQSGNVFGGGYVANSYVDISDVKVYGGIIRGGLYGGGEVGPIGRGTVNVDKPAPEGTFHNGAAKIYKGGETHVTMYKGHVMRDVFGGGRGYDNWGGDGYMTKEEEATMDLSSKGYVFGKTDVRILGGEVGTVDNIAKGYGNVFGGGNIGYVYSATGTKTEKKVPGTEDDKTYYYYDSSDNLTNDCSVLITPYCQAKSALTIPNGGTYQAGDFVPASDLDHLKKKTSADSELWEKLDLDGIIVRNAVFAGGNVSVGDNVVYANAKTVMGNVSANVVDIYNRDLITIGTEHVGGLYGDGNLTLVDGYRELNITNYGTDYYGMSDNISLAEYYSLTDRERAYFALEYRCKTAYSTYNVGDRITEDKYQELDENEQAHWEQWGFCSIYAGRLMNTIQRADFCGVFGSRMVLQGAKDRVPSVADKTDYTVNRVGEVSLNQVSTIAGESAEDVNYKHGNYFGIYSFVNYMGALTSDVNFYNTVRTTDSQGQNYQPNKVGETFYEWKKANAKNRKRNNGKVANSVALASGVYLELTTEKSTPENKDWGYITGVAQLELINVKTGLGGGYVYAKNEHGVRSLSNNDRTILSPYNLATTSHSHEKAVTNKLYVYSKSDNDQEDVQTSGNFIHNVKQIIDDCYPTSNAYSGETAAPAHYWFIRGTSYVYDQFITAYTGVSNAYSKTQKIPLNINAASNGKMKLEDVKENLYAYYYDYSSRTPLQNTDPTQDTYGVLVNNNKTYHLNDSITYWDWLQLSEKDQRHFVKETYLTIAECKIGNTTYPEGTVLLPSEYENLKANHSTVYHVAKGQDVDFDFVFRPSNNLSHALGYVVTYSVDNPTQWNTQNPDCTYSPTTTGVYGQRFYDVGEVIDKTTHDDYENMGEHKPTDTEDRKQAKMDVAYVTTEDVTFTDGSNTYNFIEGTVLCKKDYSEAAWNSISSKVETAHVCTSTLEFEGDNAPKSMIYGEVITTKRYNEVVNLYMAENNGEKTMAEAEAAVNQLLSPAWLCYEAGYYGGGYFETGRKYTALKAWSSLSEEDRQHFTFNYDALNLLIDPDYSGITPKYDNNVQDGRYSSVQPINYQAVYTGESTLTYTDNNGASKSIAPNATIEREQFEAIPNEKNHYSPIAVENTTMYVVNTPFARGDMPYTTGQTITAETYGYLSNDQKNKVTELTFAEEDKGETFYYCRENYTINATNGNPVKSIKGVTGTYARGATVPVGAVIEGTSTTEGYIGYNNLTNLQTSFTIQGNSPEELTTLYVARQSDIFDLQKDRIITVIYSYDYTESDESGTHIEPISERHIINIHLHFESGVPEIATLNSPKAALPGDNVGLVKPAVKPGAYEIMGGGWELFPTEDDAMRHRNGREFTNKTPVYWYQDGQYLAYYAKTYLGKTYSNHVPMNVANYHDLKEVMTDMDHHMYVDHPDVKRASKIYINDYSEDDKSGLDLLKDLYDLSVGSNLTGHAPLNERVNNMQNLEVFFHANTAPKAYANNWTPLANGENQCYNGTIHGEGYHIDGLTNSFIGHLCGHVYNLGVNGSFTSAGLADTGDGYVENCWVKTTATPNGSVYAVFGNPSDNSATAWRQIENCYYAVGGGDYKTTEATHGLAVRKPERAFYNGEVAYNLNGYYMKERYNRQAAEANKIDTYGYVEDRYKNVDFLYSNGTIPTEDDPRLTTDAQGNYYYAPIWPDDYLFFGQTLTYGYQYPETGMHQAVPSHLTKAGTANTLNIVSSSNRVYRTPAYFGNKTMGIFHFNPYAVMAAKSADGQYEAYPGMTAVDFTAHNDQSYTKTESNGIFFAPVTDGLTTLTGVANANETKNLLVYSPKQGTDMVGILTNYFGVTEPEMAEKEDNESTGMKAEYRAVDALTSDELYGINGHLAYIDDNGSYWAHNDHVLVDKQDFNCPISYSLDNEHRMWYQRTPDNFVTMQAGSKRGWESVSIPFEAELVTTPDKGEITHFYGNSTKGHEYWLREFKGGSISETDNTIFEATFQKPAAGTEPKNYTNTFLWDYYYNYRQRKDANSDEYQNYYSTSHDYVGYPLSQAGTPYIVGFPGDYYYEFDLSGSFVPENTYDWPYERTLGRQTITFASKKGVTIAVSDDELNEVKVSNCNYAFQPNYSSRELDGSAYVLNADGSSYEKVATTTAAIPFRPYFTSATAGSRTRSIVFGDENSQFGGDEDMNQSHTGQNLIITARGHKIVVESQLRHVTDVRIVTPAGVTLKTFTIQPGEVVETFMINAGIYIVQSTDARYTKKLAVR